MKKLIEKEEKMKGRNEDKVEVIKKSSLLPQIQVSLPRRPSFMKDEPRMSKNIGDYN